MPMFFTFSNKNQSVRPHKGQWAARSTEQNIDALFAKFGSGQYGLTENDALSRLEAEGRNEVARERVPNPLVQLLRAFNNPFIYVLLIISAVSFYSDYWLPLQTGEETDGTGVTIIVTMVLISGIMRSSSPVAGVTIAVSGLSRLDPFVVVRRSIPVMFLTGIAVYFSAMIHI